MPVVPGIERHMSLVLLSSVRALLADEPPGCRYLQQHWVNSLSLDDRVLRCRSLCRSWYEFRAGPDRETGEALLKSRWQSVQHRREPCLRSLLFPRAP